MRNRSVGRISLMAIAACLLAHVAYAQYPPSRVLSTTIQVAASWPRPEGLSFEVFGRPPRIEFVVVIVNDSPDTLTFPASFAADLRVRVKRGERPVDANIAWERIEAHLPEDDPTDVSQVVPFNLLPEGVARFHGVLSTATPDAFAAGDYVVSLDLGRAFAGVRDTAGKRWTGHYAEEGSFALRVTEPRTPAERRRANLTAANAATEKGDTAEALRIFLEMLRVDPNDLEARYGSGQAYFDLDRYREAAAAFEAVIPHIPKDERSAVFHQAAFAYVALGDDARALAILTNRYGAESAQRELSRIKENVRRR